jgi:hypothetical protein
MTVLDDSLIINRWKLCATMGVQAVFDTLDATLATSGCGRLINRYNYQRCHETLSNLTPMAIEKRHAIFTG